MGILIETYRINKGELPTWNAVSGNIFGQKSATEGNYEIVKCFTSIEPSPLTARYSLRELSNDPVVEGHENFLHAARILMLSMGITYKESLGIIRRNDSLDIYNQLLSSNYFSKRLSLYKHNDISQGMSMTFCMVNANGRFAAEYAYIMLFVAN